MTRSPRLARDLVLVALALPALAAPASIANDMLAPSHALAQDAQPAAVTAEVVAARVQAFYDQTRTVQARFQQSFWIRAHARTVSSRGSIVIQRPGRIRFDYAQPRGKVVVSTPEGFTYYEPGDDGGAGQFTRGTSDAASAALGFLTGTSRLDRDFRFSLRAPGGGAPAHTDALELRPRRADPHYRRIVLYVSNEANSLGVVRRVSIEDPDGNWNRFDFSELQFNRDVSASTFDFRPPAGAHEVTAPSGGPGGAAAPGTGTGAAGLPAPGSG